MGVAVGPWPRRVSIRSPGPVAAQASGSVRALRVRAEASHVRPARAWALAKAGMVSPLEMLRPGPATTSVAHWEPAVSRTNAPSGSATRKLLS